MPRLRIDLREGFAGDTVEIALDGRILYTRVDVRTDHALGLADVVESDVAMATATIEVRLVERRVAGRLRTKLVAGANHVAVAVAGDRVAIHRLDEAPPYL